MRYPDDKPAFLATCDASDQYTYATTIGNTCYVRARQADGHGLFVESKYQPTYFLPANEHTGYATFDGRPLLPHVCDTIRDGREFLERNPNAHGNIQCEYMFLGDIYGSNHILPDMSRLYLWNIDIEVDSADAFAPPENPFNEVVTITVRWRQGARTGVVVYGMKPYTASNGVVYTQYPDEESMLRAFMDDWRNNGNYPDIITGWFVQFFDIPYLINRMTKLFGEKFTARLSPFERIRDRRVTLNHRDEQVFDIIGVSVLDYYELYRKFTQSQQESYRIDHIAHLELGERKLSYAEYKTLARLYRENFQKFVDYNIRDVELVDRLDQKLKFIELVCALAYSAKANFVDTFRQVRLWDIMIYHHLRSQHRQIPPRREQVKNEQYAGGYVKEPLVGMHQWVVSFDVASMYPHIIRQWNLSPETIIDRSAKGKYRVDQFLDKSVNVHAWVGPLAGNDHAFTVNGLQTAREPEGFLPAMLKTLYEERKRYKKMANDAEKARSGLSKDDPQYQVLTEQMAAYNNQQLVRKVNLNSAYGALGSEYFRFYDTDIAEAVTITGQLTIQWIAKAVNGYLNRIFKTDRDYVIASDTDSIYVTVAPIVEKFKAHKPDATMDACVSMVDAFCTDKIQPVITASFDELAQYLNVAVPCLTMAREVIADKGIWRAKKHYILNVRDKEGKRLPEPKLKMMGIEAVKSSTPSLCRTMIKHALHLLMNGTEQDVWDYVAKQRSVFFAGSFEDVAFPRSVKDLDKYSHQEKGIPIHTNGALVYNRFIAEHKSYDPIRDGQKIRFSYLKIPNRFFSHVLSAPDGCPPEWEIEKVLDYETQWQKSFIEPLQGILSAAGWHVEKQDSLF